MNDYADLFGKTTDAEIAELAGVTHTTVRRWRESLGIPRYDPDKIRRQVVLNQPDLGRVKDRIIADRLGVSRKYVCNIRIRHTDLRSGNNPSCTFNLLRKAGWC